MPKKKKKKKKKLQGDNYRRIKMFQKEGGRGKREQGQMTHYILYFV